MRKCRLVLVCALLLISPIILNYLLSRNALWNYTVVGEGKDWLPYYGSIMSSIAAFYILYQTLMQNRNLALLSHKHEELKLLKRDIARIISSIDLTQIIENSLYVDGFNCTQELLRLNALAQYYTKESNAVFLVYGNSNDEYALDFCNAFCTIIDSIVKEDIDEMTRTLVELRSNTITKDEYKQRLLVVAKRITEERQQYYKVFVYPSAQRYLMNEEKKYSNLIEK